MARYKHIRSGKLELVRKSRSGGRGVGAVWWAVCDCGNEVEVLARKVVSGQRSSCGKCGQGLGIGQTEQDGIPVGMRTQYHRLLGDPRRKTDPTSTMYLSLRGKRCIICNTQRNVFPEWDDTGTGLVPLCSQCYRARGKGKLVELLEWISVVYERIQERLRRGQ